MTGSTVLAKLAVLISAQTAEFDRKLQQTQNKLQAFSSNVNKVTAGLSIAAGLNQLFTVVKYGVGTIADFEARMSEVKAITGATGKEFDDLRNNALQLGRSTKYTSEQVAELQVAYGRLGFSTKEILQVTEATLDLATATGEDLAKSADIAGSTLRGFGLDASEMERVIDVMASSFNKSALGLENFSEAMKYVAPVAAANNISLEETTALLGTLADNGIRGSMAGTSLRKIISDLDKGTKPLNEKLKDLAAKGFNSADAMDEVGRTAYAALLTLVKYTDKTNELTSALGEATGEADKMASVMEDNLIGDFTKLTSAIDGLVLKFSDASEGLREMTQDATKLINLLSSDKAVKFLSGWFKLVTIVPRTTLKGLGAGVDFLDGDSFGGAQSTWEEIEKTATNIQKQVVSIDSLQEKLKQINAEYEATSIFDTGRLKSLAQEANALDEKIKRLQMIRKLEGMDAAFFDPTSSGFFGKFAGVNNIKSSLTDGLGVDLESIVERLTAVVNRIKPKAQEIKDTFLDLSAAIGSSLSSLANDIGQALGGDKTIRFGDAILKALAVFASSVGEALIGIGTAMLAAKVMIKNPATAIAAGVALVALAGAMNASLSKAQSSFNSSGSVPSTSHVRGGYNNRMDEMKIHISGTLEGKGDKIISDIQRWETKRTVKRG